MNDMVYLGIGIVAFMACVLFIIGLNTYSGVHGSLKNAKIGEVYNFIYEQPLNGEPERYLAKIVDVYVMSDDAIRRLNKRSNYRKYDSNFQRTNHLVTAQTFDGKIRNFYAERTSNVRKSLFGGVLLKTGLASLLF